MATLRDNALYNSSIGPYADARWEAIHKSTERRR